MLFCLRYVFKYRNIYIYVYICMIIPCSFSLGPLFCCLLPLFSARQKTPTGLEDLQSLLRTVSTVSVETAAVSDAPEPTKPKRRRLKQCE